MKNSSWLIRGLSPLFGLVFFLAVWQVASLFYHHVIIPSPVEVARAFFLSCPAVSFGSTARTPLSAA